MRSSPEASKDPRRAEACYIFEAESPHIGVVWKSVEFSASQLRAHSPTTLLFLRMTKPTSESPNFYITPKFVPRHGKFKMQQSSLHGGSSAAPRLELSTRWPRVRD
ncbi:hypothetical protein TNCV_1589711 [Trichonephila clavipes]|uniref:Uncharacterized protein n=1 Tax=Trichonephila clavipes TaxID=2585209 RepID=A0A8X6RNX2_TRICX|nr:hypothetical protein TNCV_1589711 [Trichonephila clavipes]